MARRSKSRTERYREKLAEVIWSKPEHWQDAPCTEIWLESPEAIKKFLDELALAAMTAADEERGAERGDSGSTKL